MFVLLSCVFIVLSVQFDVVSLLPGVPVGVSFALSRPTLIVNISLSQLYSFLEKNYICEDFQSEFRPSHSTDTFHALHVIFTLGKYQETGVGLSLLC